MALLNEDEVENHDHKLKKHLLALKDPARKAKNALKDTLQKSEKRIKEELNEIDGGATKSLTLKKMERVSKELEILNSLSEDDIVKFALTTRQNIMRLASNPRLPKDLRMKARIASHKPLSSHLARIKATLGESEELESNEETSNVSSKKLDKTLLNIQIVNMRKDVRRARIHLINKLTKIITKLRNSKASGEKKAKFERKAERLVKKIMYMKELIEDDVSRFALSTTQDLNKLSGDIKMPMRTQAMALIALHKFVATQVADFKRTFPDWEKTVPAILKQKRKKNRFTVQDAGNGKGPTLNNKSSAGNSEEERSEEEESSDEDRASCEREESDGGFRVQEDVSEQEESDHQASGHEEPSDLEEGNNREESGHEESSDLEEGSDHEDDCDRGEARSQKGRSPIQSIKRTRGRKLEENGSIIPTIKKSRQERQKLLTKRKKTDSKVNDEEPIKETYVMPKSSKQSSCPNLNEKKVKTVDPFFMTTSNEEYMTSQIPKGHEDNTSSWEPRNDDSGPMKQKTFNTFLSKNRMDFKDNKQNKFNHRSSQLHKKPVTTRSEKEWQPSKTPAPTSTGNMFGTRKERRKGLQQVYQEKTEKLHPSWEAKKKQTSIAAFQGKKISFD